LSEVYERCIKSKDDLNQPNHVQSLYGLFTDEEISEKITEIVRPKGMQAELEVVFQTVENLHKAIPNHSGDWYFTGNYPTPGGMRVSNRAFANYMDGKLVRAY
jgi:amidophosphoribosyltransferase